MVRFCTEVSSNLVLEYYWRNLPVDGEKIFHSLFPTTSVLMGGGPLFDVEHLESCLQGFVDTGEALALEHPGDANLWLCSVPIMNLDCGDYLGMYCGDENTLEQPVVYLCDYGHGESRCWPNPSTAS